MKRTRDLLTETIRFLGVPQKNLNISIGIARICTNLGFQSLTIVVKLSILDLCRGLGFSSNRQFRNICFKKFEVLQILFPVIFFRLKQLSNYSISIKAETKDNCSCYFFFNMVFRMSYYFLSADFQIQIIVNLIEEVKSW